MSSHRPGSSPGRSAATAIVSAFLFASGVVLAAEPGKLLGGDQEVPAVKTLASASSRITVTSGMAVIGTVKTSRIEGTMAHIHQGAAGANGPVVVTLTNATPNTWSVPTGTRLTVAQYASFQRGEMYVNVHSAAHPAGEIRLQLSP